MRGALGLALRALSARRGVSLAVVVVAVFVVAAATAGPVYLRAAGESVLQDALADAGPVSTGLTATLGGSVQGDPDRRLRAATAAGLEGTARYEDPVHGLEAPVGLRAPGPSVVVSRLVLRDRACAQLELEGSCPQAAGDVAVSEDAARRLGVRPGSALDSVGGLALRVTAVYRLADPDAVYWGGRSFVGAGVRLDPGGGDERIDALFTAPPTLGLLPATAPLTATADVQARLSTLRLAEAAAVEDEATAALRRLQAQAPDAVVATGLPQLLERVQSSADLLRGPVLLVVLQLLVLSWLVLFGVVAGSVDARGPEIALAKLRGLSERATAGFGLLEPLLLLLLAVPPGVLAGLLAVRAVAGTSLSDEAVVTLPPSGLVAAGVAVLGGAVAAALAARSTLARPALEQFRRTSPRATRRGWAVDVAVLVLTLAGLVQLVVSGAVSGGEVDPVALLTPGLLSLAMALLVARLLPAACRALIGPTRARSRLGLFLAVRQVARRPAGGRVVVVLVVAFGLASFSISSWSVARDNRADLARTVVGAEQVVPVRLSAGQDLRAAVEEADPDGRWAMAVSELEQLSSSRSGRRLLAVDTERLAAVGFWRSDFSARGPAALADQLRPPAAPPVLVTGERLTVRVQVGRLVVTGLPRSAVHLTAELRDSGNLLRRVDLGALPDGDVALTAAVPCREGCRLAGLRVTRDGFATVTGSLVVTGLAADGQALDAGLTEAGRWRPLADEGNVPTLRPVGNGLSLSVATTESSDPGAAPADVPLPLPAVLTPAVGEPGGAPVQVVGLDATPLQVQPVASADALPRGQADGILVDRTYAFRALGPGTPQSVDAVWLGPDAPADAVQRLAATGLQLGPVERASDLEDRLSRQGPALALLLFLLGAVAAAVLAASGTVLTLYLLGRRRTGELAAVRALGVTPRALRSSLLVEQGLLVGTGALGGVVAGLLGALLALPSVPQFDELPEAPDLLYVPDVAVVGGFVALTLLLLAVAVLVAVVALVRGARLDRLREGAA